jgi:uncharacterized protein (TIGR03118 family)
MKTMMMTALLTGALLAPAANALDNAYMQHNFVANKKEYNATLATDDRFINAWGISIRPKGAGGHFWVTAKDISYEYVGDVRTSPDETLRTLHQDGLREVKLPVGGDDKFATGTVFSGSSRDFVITQPMKDAKPITAPARFLFASDGGIISAWTERKHQNGKTEWPAEAVSVIDHSTQGAQFFGLALSSDYRRLYAADFGVKPAIKVFDGKFKQIDLTFDNPFDDNKNGAVDAGEYAPFNIQALNTPEGKNHLFVAYAKTQPCPEKAVKEGACKAGEVYAGEEDISVKGNGRLAEFTEDGKLVAVWQDRGKLSAPWGVAFAPKDFGKLSGALLVSNFGDGTIAGYDPNTLTFVDVLRDTKGKPIVIDKIWGILFGNGESLGDANALYFAAGVNDEKDGVFGSLRAHHEPRAR